MHTTISKQTKIELLGTLRQRYLAASSREGKTRILDEFVALADVADAQIAGLDQWL